MFLLDLKINRISSMWLGDENKSHAKAQQLQLGHRVPVGREDGCSLQKNRRRGVYTEPDGPTAGGHALRAQAPIGHAQQVAKRRCRQGA